MSQIPNQQIGPAGREFTEYVHAPHAVGAWTSFRRTLYLLMYCLFAAAAIAGTSYLSLKYVAVPIGVGVLLCFVLVMLLALLHHGIWICLLSVLPSLFVLVGAVQYAPEAALENRGVHEQVTVTRDEGSGDRHRLILSRADGSTLDETLDRKGSVPEVGERLEVVRDPQGVVPMEEAADVDAAGRLGSLVSGLVTWVLLTGLAGWRGHVRRRKGLYSDLDF